MEKLIICNHPTTGQIAGIASYMTKITMYQFHSVFSLQAGKYQVSMFPHHPQVLLDPLCIYVEITGPIHSKNFLDNQLAIWNTA